MFQKISGIEKFYASEGYVTIFFRKFFVSHSRKYFPSEFFWCLSAENFGRGILHCFINFGYRRSLDKRGGEYHDFPSKFFCLTVPEYFVGEPFCAVFRKISGIEKNEIREVEHQDYPSKFFWSLIAENFRRGSSTGALI